MRNPARIAALSFSFAFCFASAQGPATSSTATAAEAQAFVDVEYRIAQGEYGCRPRGLDRRNRYHGRHRGHLCAIERTVHSSHAALDSGKSPLRSRQLPAQLRRQITLLQVTAPAAPKEPDLLAEQTQLARN